MLHVGQLYLSLVELHLHCMYVQYTTSCTEPANFLSLAVGLDFIFFQTELTFTEGTSDGDVIFIDILDDILVEGTENFTLTGSVAAPASFVGGPVTVSIIDNDGKCVAVTIPQLYTLVTECRELDYDCCGTHNYP